MKRKEKSIAKTEPETTLADLADPKKIPTTLCVWEAFPLRKRKPVVAWPTGIEARWVNYEVNQEVLATWVGHLGEDRIWHHPNGTPYYVPTEVDIETLRAAGARHPHKPNWTEIKLALFRLGRL